MPGLFFGNGRKHAACLGKESRCESGTKLAGQRDMTNPHVFDANDVIALRARYDLTQVQFAQLIGISPETLRNWETSRRNPMGPARALLRILSADPDKVLSVLQKHAEEPEFSSCEPQSS